MADIVALSSQRQKKRCLTNHLHKKARQLMPYDDRIHFCGSHVQNEFIKPGVILTETTNGETCARIRGIARCGSSWSCPTCGALKAEQRTQTAAAIIKTLDTQRYSFVFMTFTCFHKPGMGLNDLIDRHSKAMQVFKQDKSARNVKKAFEFQGAIIGADSTWSDKNGWHWHIHELWACAKDSDDIQADIEQFKSTLKQRWQHACKRSGLYASLSNGLHIKQMFSPDHDTVGYIAKISDPVREVSSQYTKGGRKEGHMTPFQILEKYANTTGKLKRRMAAVYKEYVESTKGRRQFRIDTKLKGLYEEITGELIELDPDLVESLNAVKPEEHFIPMLGSTLNWVLMNDHYIEFLERCEADIGAAQRWAEEGERLSFLRSISGFSEANQDMIVFAA